MSSRKALPDLEEVWSSGLVVIRLCREVNVACGQVELGAIFLQRIVAEDAKGHVFVAVGLRLGRGLLQETEAIFEQAVAFRENGSVVAGSLRDGFTQVVNVITLHSFLPNQLLELGDLRQQPLFLADGR